MGTVEGIFRKVFLRRCFVSYDSMVKRNSSDRLPSNSRERKEKQQKHTGDTQEKTFLKSLAFDEWLNTRWGPG